MPNTPEPTCDKCQLPCKECQTTKVNCISCEPTSSTPAHFTLEVETSNGPETRGTCLAVCPLSYFLDDFSIPGDKRCSACSSPCATCEGRADKCMSCDGTGNKYFVD